MELRTLRSFVAVAEELHFTRAAERLHIAQPALSQQIRQLERDVGVQLVDRSKRAVRLTPAGEVLLEHARSVLEAAAGARLAAQRAARGEVGHLSVGFVPSARDLLPLAVRAFRGGSPEVEVTVREMDSHAQVEGLLGGTLHVGLVNDTVVRTGLDGELLRGDRFMVALPKGHRLAKRRAIPLRELRDESFIVPTVPSGGVSTLNRMLLAAYAKAGFVPTIAHRTADLSTRLVQVASGMGITMVLEHARPAQMREVVFRPLAGPPLILQLFAVWRSGAEAAPVRAFRAALRAAARANGASGGS